MLKRESFLLKKPAEKSKGRYLLANPEVIADGQRPFSTGDLKGRKDCRLKNGIFDRSRAVTYNVSSSSYFYDFANTATCYNCLFDAVQGRQFCEIMGSKYCHECIRERRKKDIEEEVSSALGISQNVNEASLSDAILHERQEHVRGIRSPCSMALPNDRKWFVRLHNLNTKSKYYINPVDGIKTNLATSSQTGPSTPVETGESEIRAVRIHETPNQSEFLLVPENDQGTVQTFERSSKRKKRKLGTANSKGKFVTFNGLPIEPPLITVDLCNQIMNHTTLNHFIGLSSYGS